MSRIGEASHTGALEDQLLTQLLEVPWRQLRAQVMTVRTDEGECEDEDDSGADDQKSGDNVQEAPFYIKLVTHAESSTTSGPVKPSKEKAIGYTIVVTDLTHVWVGRARSEKELIREITTHCPSFLINGPKVVLSYLDKSLGQYIRSEEAEALQLPLSKLDELLCGPKAQPGPSLNTFTLTTAVPAVPSQPQYVCVRHVSSNKGEEPGERFDLHATLPVSEAVLRWTFVCRPLTVIRGQKCSHELASSRFIKEYWLAPLMRLTSCMALQLAQANMGRYLLDNLGRVTFLPDAPVDPIKAETFGLALFNVGSALQVVAHSSQLTRPANLGSGTEDAVERKAIILEGECLAKVDADTKPLQSACHQARDTGGIKGPMSANSVSVSAEPKEWSAANEIERSAGRIERPIPPANAIMEMRIENVSSPVDSTMPSVKGLESSASGGTGSEQMLGSSSQHSISSTKNATGVPVPNNVSTNCEPPAIGTPRPLVPNVSEESSNKRVQLAEGSAEEIELELARRRALEQLVQQQQKANRTRKKGFV